MFEEFLARLGQIRIVPVIALEDAAGAAPLAEALVSGGLPVAEVTFRTAAAAESIATMAKRSDILVGAGTVRSVDQAEAARDAGATFLVTPGFNAAVVDWALAAGMPILPGIDSTLGIEMATAKGLTTLKFFPAATSGGLAALKALSAPYGDVRFVPTGGIGPGNVAEWLAHPAVTACGGSWLVKKDLLAAGDWETVERLTREAVELAAG